MRPTQKPNPLGAHGRWLLAPSAALKPCGTCRAWLWVDLLRVSKGILCSRDLLKDPVDAVHDAPAALPAPAPAPRLRLRPTDFGVYLHLHAGTTEAAAVRQVRSVAQHLPKTRRYVVSDGGVDLSQLCQKEG